MISSARLVQFFGIGDLLALMALLLPKMNGPNTKNLGVEGDILEFPKIRNPKNHSNYCLLWMGKSLLWGTHVLGNLDSVLGGWDDKVQSPTRKRCSAQHCTIFTSVRIFGNHENLIVGFTWFRLYMLPTTACSMRTKVKCHIVGCRISLEIYISGNWDHRHHHDDDPSYG